MRCCEEAKVARILEVGKRQEGRSYLPCFVRRRMLIQFLALRSSDGLGGGFFFSFLWGSKNDQSTCDTESWQVPRFISPLAGLLMQKSLFRGLLDVRTHLWICSI